MKVHTLLATIKDFNATGRILRSLSPELEGHGVSSSPGAPSLVRCKPFKIAYVRPILNLSNVFKKASQMFVHYTIGDKQ